MTTINNNNNNETNNLTYSKFSKNVTGLYLKSIKEIIDQTINSDESVKYEAQLKLENSWIDLVKDKLKDDKYLIESHSDKVLPSITSAKKILDLMEEEKSLITKFPKVGKYLNNIELIVTTFTLCLSLYSRLSYNSLIVKVGQDLIYQIWSGFPNKFKQETSYNEFKESLNLETEDIYKLGDFFLTLLQSYPRDLFYREIRKDSYYTKDPCYLKVNGSYLDKIRKNIIIDPKTLPMICQPREWSEDSHGGYINNMERGADIITGSDTHKHITENKVSIYESVNYLNSVKLGMNNLLLNYITSEEGMYLLEHVKAEDELQRTITLEVAKVYSNVPFYLNTHADWRGRIYTQSFFLSYQAGDLSFSLINIWEGEKLNEEGKFYLYIYGANSHDQNKISKASYQDRINWVQENYDKIINLDKELILSAESPFIFTAFCLNMREYHNNPDALIKTPVFLDATCSGIQHLAGLMKDLELGANTNLVKSTIKQKPGDVYQTLLEPINKAINEFGKNNIEFSMLSLVKLTRKEVKTPIMTKVYNVTKYGISKQLQSVFKIKNSEIFENEFYTKPLKEVQKDILESLKQNKGKDNESDIFACNGIDGKKVILTKKEVFKIASIINEQIFVVFPSLNKIYNYFIDWAKLAVELKISLVWITPSGLIINQNYHKKNKVLVNLSIFGKTKRIILRLNTDKVDKMKQVQSIIPNIIHSLDASHLMNIIKNAKSDNFDPVLSIHDCFGTLPNKMGSLEHRVKKEFILLYSDNKFLKNYQDRLIQNLKDNNFELKEINGKLHVFFRDTWNEIPTIPPLGKLDLEEISQSKYMIS